MLALPLRSNIWTLAPKVKFTGGRKLVELWKDPLSRYHYGGSIKARGSIKLCNDQRPSIVYPITKVQGRGELSNGRFRNSKGFQVWQTQRAAPYFRACLSARACTSSLSLSLALSRSPPSSNRFKNRSYPIPSSSSSFLTFLTPMLLIRDQKRQRFFLSFLTWHVWPFFFHPRLTRVNAITLIGWRRIRSWVEELIGPLNNNKEN